MDRGRPMLPPRPSRVVIVRHRTRTLRNTERFWYAYAQTPAPRRTQSLPPRHRFRLLPKAPPPPPPRSLASRLLRGIRKGSEKCIDKGRRLYRQHRTKILAVAAVAIIGVAAAAMRHNRKLALAQPSVLDRYKYFPSFMYADDPTQALGLPPAIAPGVVPPQDAIRAACREYQKRWHPDKWMVTGIANPEQANAVAFVGPTICDAFERYYANPYCEKNTEPLETFAVDPALPHFRPGCECTKLLALITSVKSAVVPYFWQQLPPQTEADLADFCPCDFAMANRKRLVPPPLRRIPYPEFPWTLFSGGPPTEEQKRQWIEAGWAVEADFDPMLQNCG